MSFPAPITSSTYRAPLFTSSFPDDDALPNRFLNPWRNLLTVVTTGNTQAPCAIIGERAAAMIRAAHGM